MRRRYGWMVCVFCAAMMLTAGCKSGAEPEPEPQPAKTKPAKPAGPAVTGRLASPPVSGLGFQHAILALDVAPSGEVEGTFGGGYEQKRFEVDLSGAVAEDGTLSATGEGTDGKIRVEGPLDEQGFSGEITGTVFTEQFSLPLAAQPVAPAPQGADDATP